MAMLLINPLSHLIYKTFEVKKKQWEYLKKNNFWQLWDSNPRPFGLVPKTSALDHSAKLPVEAIGLCN